MNEFDYTRKTAKEFLKEGDYLRAKEILEKLWEDSEKGDLYLLYDYGEALQKTGNSTKFVDICRNKEKIGLYMSNKYIKSKLCWCIYEGYIREYIHKSENIKEFQDFLQRAEFIVNNCVQEDTDKFYITPYVLTVRKVVKIYKEKGTNYRAILKWLEYLNPEKLPEKVFIYTDNKGSERENASLKEFYYQYKASALEKVREYEKCVECCETAFNVIEKFHYRNHIWLKERMLYSKCMLADDEKVASKCIKEYEELACKENYWYMYHKISQYYYMNNNIEEALYFASKAICVKFDGDNMNKLILDIGFLYENTGNIEYAKIFFHASAFYREKNKWSISEELEYKIKEYSLNIKEKPPIGLIKSICRKQVAIKDEKKKLYGNIKKIFINRGYGFINSNISNENDVYFKVADIIGKKVLKNGQKVEYEITKDGKGRKIAVKIKGVS